MIIPACVPDGQPHKGRTGLSGAAPVPVAPAVAYVCLGSNQGDAPAHLAAARQELEQLDGVQLTGVSRVYLTEPQGDADQPWFANQVVRLACAEHVSAYALLDALLQIEQRMGRERDPARRYGPRVIDLDLLSHGDVCCASARLTLPHPRLAERAFVLVPLCELEPELMLPDGRAVRQLLQALAYRVQDNRIYQ